MVKNPLGVDHGIGLDQRVGSSSLISAIGLASKVTSTCFGKNSHRDPVRG